MTVTCNIWEVFGISNFKRRKTFLTLGSYLFTSSGLLIGVVLPLKDNSVLILFMYVYRCTFFVCVCVCLSVWDRVSLHSLGCLGIHYVEQAELTEICLPLPLVHTTIPGYRCILENFYSCRFHMTFLERGRKLSVNSNIMGQFLDEH